ncbi:hypothetical protein BgiBS90_035988 [Biomphalaria glabrata]|nr:hypothetical protein BgiBS90_035988 [Biomphalaria glabrata]KAI8744746.1 hypothetical protein BgiMline_020146 [Biomphalaria glabrata]
MDCDVGKDDDRQRKILWDNKVLVNGGKMIKINKQQCDVLSPELNIIFSEEAHTSKSFMLDCDVVLGT